MKNLVLLLLLLHVTVSYAQIPKAIFQGDSDVQYAENKFTISKLPLMQSAGVYHFGESEGEWDLIIISFRGKIILQISENEWGKSAISGKDTWLKKYRAFNKVTFEGSNFKFEKYRGTFASFKGNIKKAIILNGDPTEDIIYGVDTAEAGHFETDLATYFNHKRYPAVSLRAIDEKYLTGKSMQELKYIRDEIFAMYGLIFQDKKTAALFQKRYIPWRQDVSDSLTDIEKYNLKVIKAYEEKMRFR